MKIVVCGQTKKEECQRVLESAVQNHIDSTARQKRYNCALCISSYRTDPNPTWAAEAECFINWRSSVWQFVFDWWDDVDNNVKDMPTDAEELIAALPEIEWPEEGE